MSSFKLDLRINNNDQQRRILIVDDEPYNILGLTIQLSQMGFKGIKQLIDKAFNGMEAFQMVRKAHKDGLKVR